MDESSIREADKEKRYPYVNRETRLMDIVQNYPVAADIIMEYGLHCLSCGAARFENFEQGCAAHGFPEEIISKLLLEVNECIASDRGEELPKK